VRRVAVAFVDETEQLCTQPCITLRNELTAQVGLQPLSRRLRRLTFVCDQARAYVDATHRGTLEKVEGLLRSEQWAPTAVPADVQAIADALGGSQSHQLPSPPAEGAAAAAAAEAAIGVSDYFVVGERRMRIPTACVLVRAVFPGHCEHARSRAQAIPMLSWYGQAVAALPQQAAELAMRLAEVLRRFNTVACQMVLGAGAMSQAGLRSITAKHIGRRSLWLSRR
jgi:vacuolar protein sorting-associated protein 54